MKLEIAEEITISDLFAKIDEKLQETLYEGLTSGNLKLEEYTFYSDRLRDWEIATRALLGLAAQE